MANTFIYQFPNAGLTTLYGVLMNAITHTLVKVLDGSALALLDANWSAAAITLSDNGHSNYYGGTLPTGLADGLYSMIVCNSAAPAITDAPVGASVTFQVVGGQIVHLTLDALGHVFGTLTPAVSLDQCVCTGVLYDEAGDPLPGEIFEYRLLSTDTVSGQVRGRAPRRITSDASGTLTLTLVRGDTYQLRYDSGEWVTFDVPDAGSATITEVLGRLRC